MLKIPASIVVMVFIIEDAQNVSTNDAWGIGEDIVLYTENAENVIDTGKEHVEGSLESALSVIPDADSDAETTPLS